MNKRFIDSLMLTTKLHIQRKQGKHTKMSEESSEFDNQIRKENKKRKEDKKRKEKEREEGEELVKTR